jgi:hypothetical protein
MLRTIIKMIVSASQIGYENGHKDASQYIAKLRVRAENDPEHDAQHAAEYKGSIKAASGPRKQVIA